MAATVFTIAQLLNPPAYDTVKTDVYTRLEAAGFTSIQSFAPESLPVAMVETEAQNLDQVNQTAAFLTASAYNDTATGDALAELAREVYQVDKQPGTFAQGYVKLSDHGQGPFDFDPTSVSVSTGDGGGKVFNGIAVGGVTTLTLAKNGTVKLYVQAEAIGAAYNVAAGTIKSFSRGPLAGVTITNPPGWQADQYGVTGVNPESDSNLRQRDRTQWGLLSQFKASTVVQSGYEKMARDADPQVTRVRILTNLDILDPGRVDVVIAGNSGALSPTVVAAVQNFTAPLQTGGPKIPETAKVVVSSALNLTVTLTGVIVVDPAYNTQSFLDQINANLTAWFASFLIGGGKLGSVSYDRVVGIIMLPAGNSNTIIYDGSNVKINGMTDDLPIAYNEVPVLVSQLQLQAV